MFNRKLQISLAKDNPPNTTPVPPDTAVDYLMVTRALVHETGKVVGGYVLLDTIRRVAIAYATK